MQNILSAFQHLAISQRSTRAKSAPKEYQGINCKYLFLLDFRSPQPRVLQAFKAYDGCNV
jgi:hypothetical protein